MAEEQQLFSGSSSTSSLVDSDEELRHMPLAPPPWQKRKRMSKQLSMCEMHRLYSKQLSMCETRRLYSKQLSMCETRRDIAWEERRRQILGQERRRGGIQDYCDDLTDGDLNELKGSIELGFGFNEEDGQTLCNTLPALDLYFAVNRQLSSCSTVSTPQSLGDRSSSFGSVRSDCESWKICSPGHTFYTQYFHILLISCVGLVYGWSCKKVCLGLQNWVFQRIYVFSFHSQLTFKV